MSQEETYMRLALEQAQHAMDTGEVPVGAVIIRDGGAIAVAHNEKEARQDPTAHAELLAIRRAAKTLDSWRLVDTSLFVTLEPCAMCAGAILNSRIKRVVFGCTDEKSGTVRTLYRLLEDKRFNHRCEVVEGVLAVECAAILSLFFKRHRQKID